jgi:hypothetical protein
MHYANKCEVSGEMDIVFIEEYNLRRVAQGNTEYLHVL